MKLILPIFDVTGQEEGFLKLGDCDHKSGSNDRKRPLLNKLRLYVKELPNLGTI
jgi:hypothetical protein